MKHTSMFTRRALLCFCLLTALSAAAQKKNPIYVSYINTYRDIAMEHQRRYKIPASITLAQGLLESSAGTSELAKKSNNHFGIKCHNSWDGKRVYHDDDEKGECFRKYSNPKESYHDHALFLTRSPRYDKLFKLSVTDYKGWARGLKECGYATDKAYASKLIQTIELYDLHRYDGRNMPRVPKEYEFHDVEYLGKLPYIVAREGDRPKWIAREFEKYRYQLRRFNDRPRGYTLQEGDIVYLKAKRRKAPKGYRTHVLARNESLYDVSQKYGIKLKFLLRRNHISGENVPRVGDVLKLR